MLEQEFLIGRTGVMALLAFEDTILLLFYIYIYIYIYIIIIYIKYLTNGLSRF